MIGTSAPELTHEQAAEEIEAVAFGVAPEDVTAGVIAHAARCAECAAELRSFYRVVAALALLIPRRELNRGHSAGIKSRLLAKATADRDAAGTRVPRPVVAPAPSAVLAPPAGSGVVTPARESRAPNAGRWVTVGALLVAAAAVAGLVNAMSETDALRMQLTDPAAEEPRVAELERVAAEKDAVIASISGPGVRVINLLNWEAREPLARMFWDQRNDRWTLFVYTLRQPRAGKTFQLWLGTDNGRISLGTFRPKSDGTATFTARHPLAAGALNTVSITEEKVGGATAPSGPVLLAGASR